MKVVPTTLGKQTPSLHRGMNTDGLPLCIGQCLPCASEKEKWVLVIADLGKAPNRLGKGQATGGPGSQRQCLGPRRRWAGGAGGAALGKELGC